MVLKRARQRMPAAVKRELEARGLMDAYRARPAYQRNDWLAWIGRAKQEATRERRLASMLRELAAGRGYMGMAWEPPGWTCPRCGRSFLARNARHSCTSQAPEAFLAPYPKALPLFRVVERYLSSLGDVQAEATKTQIAFRAKRRFAFLWIPALALGRGPPDLHLTFDLPRRVRSPRIKESVLSHPNVWTHHMRFARKADLDDEAKGWLREAYETRGL